METNLQKTMNAGLQRKQGFTLIELLVVVAVIIILAAIGIGASSGILAGAAEAKTIAQLKALELLLEEYRADLGQYPPTREHNDDDISLQALGDEFYTWYNNKYEDAVDAVFEGGYEPGPQGDVERFRDAWGKEFIYEFSPGVSVYTYLIGSLGPDQDISSSDIAADDENVFGKGDDISNKNGRLE